MPRPQKTEAAVEMTPAAEMPNVETTVIEKPKRGRKPKAEKPSAEKPSAEKPAAEKPRRGRKPAAKKADAVPAPRKQRAKKPEVSVIVEYHGRQVGTAAIAEAAEKLWSISGREGVIAKVELYVKEEEGAVYCVVNGEPVGRYNL